MAELLNIDADAVFGKLCRIWIWADQQSHSCNAASVTCSLLDRITNVSGFAKAMIEAGWLIEENGNYYIPNFDRHNGQTSKTRALTSKRVSRSRGDLKRNCNAESVTKSLPEKRREEKSINTNTTPPTPSGEGDVDAVLVESDSGASRKPRDKSRDKPPSFDPKAAEIPASLDTPAFRDAWSLWCDSRREIRKPLTPTATQQQLKGLADFPADEAIRYLERAIAGQWQGLFLDRPLASPALSPAAPRGQPGHVVSHSEQKRLAARAAADRVKAKYAQQEQQTSGSLP